MVQTGSEKYGFTDEIAEHEKTTLTRRPSCICSPPPSPVVTRRVFRGRGDGRGRDRGTTKVKRGRRRSRTTCSRRVSSLFAPFPLSAFETSSTARCSRLPRAQRGTGTRAGSEAAEESRGGQERAAGHERRCERTVSCAPALRFRPACARRALGWSLLSFEGARQDGEVDVVGRRGG